MRQASSSIERLLEDDYWDVRRHAIQALAVLGRDCPLKWRQALDRSLVSDDEQFDSREDFMKWLRRWLERKPETFATVKEALGI